MQMPKDSGLEMLDRIVRRSIKYYSGAFKSMKPINTGKNNSYSAKRSTAFKLPNLDNIRGTVKDTVESLFRGLNDTVSQLTAKPEKVNYNAVVSSFLPPGARLLKPQYPEKSSEIQFADLDGDKQSELVASYKTAEGIRTIILKKDDVQWYKLTEISNPEFESIHYRNNADMTGDAKNLLLLGLEPKSGARTIFAYSLADGNAKKIFSKKYHLLELQKPHSSTTSSRASLALWNEESPEIYDIELVRWNGLELEQLDHSRYLQGKVVPYYIRKLKQNPNDTVSWYNLANTMAKAGDNSNAAAAVKIALDKNPDAVLRDKFNTLKSRLG
jgi:hypothetical protein